MPHFAGQKTVYDVAASSALAFPPLFPFHSRRVHPALSTNDKGLQRPVVEAANLNIVDMFRNVLRYVAPSVPAELCGDAIRRLLLCNRILGVVRCCVADAEDGSVLWVHIVRRNVPDHSIHFTNHTR